MTIDVRTSVYPGGWIVTEQVNDSGTLYEQVMRRVMNTQDQQIRDALIKLGWTPPPPE